MRIVYFHQHFSTPKGAAGTRSYEFALKLISTGHSVLMVCGSYAAGHTGLTSAFKDGKRQGKVDGIDVLEFELPYSNADDFFRRTAIFLKFSAKCIGVVMREKYDLVFATTTPLTAGVPGIFGRWLKGKPFVFEVRDLWPELPRAMGVIRNPLILWSMSLLEWASYKSANRLIALAPGIAKGIEHRGISADRITTIPNGCDVELFADASRAWRPERVSKADLMAVFTGTHGVANGLDTVLDAAKVLKSRGRNDIKLVLIGNGKLKQGLIGRAKNEELNNVVFCDAVPKTRLSGLLASADVGLQILANVPAFYYGTSPNKFFDYLAAGLPVITNYAGWIADQIAEHKCGFAVAPGDPEAFADALGQAADERSQLLEMGARSRKLAEMEYARDKLSSQFVDWLEAATKLAKN